MKLHLLFFSFALLSIGIMPVAVAQPRSVFNHTDLNQAEAAPPLLETSESASFSTQKRTDNSAIASEDKDEVQPPKLNLIPTQEDKGAHPEQTVKDIPLLSEVEHPYTSVQWLTQEPPPTSGGESEIVQVTGVRLNPTSNGLEIILETNSNQQLLVSPSVSGKTFVANINNAQLALPEGKPFRANNPAVGITAVTVTQQGANSIRVTVAGKAGVPTEQVVQRDRTLVLNLTPAASTTAEPIEVVSTGKPPESGYTVPDATTATKTPLPLRDIPQSIQVIPRRVIQDRGVVREDELTDNVPSVQRAIGFGEASGYYIRGFFVGYENLRNGFRDLGAIAPRGFANVDRVEFLKGPAAVLYGSGFAPGGIVNTVTKKPLDTPFYNVNLTAGSYSFYYPTLDFTGPLTSNRSLLYRLNASYQNADSYRDFTGNETEFVAPAFTWRIDPRTTLSTELEYLNSNYVFESGFPLVPESLRLPVNRFLSEPGLRRTNLDSTSITYDFVHKFSDNWKIRQGFNTVIADVNVGDARIARLSLEADRRTLDRRSRKGPQDNHNYTLQNEVFGNFNTGFLRHNVLVGLELSRFNYGYKVLGARLAPIDIFDPVYGARPGPFSPSLGFAGEYGSDNLGVYFQDLVEILPNLKLLGGGRFDLNDSFNKNRPNGTLLNEQTETHFSPRVGIVYQPIKSTSLYFNWSNYFSPQFFGRSRTGAIFQPDIGEQFEAGIKQELLKNRLSATLALYQITRQNVLTADPVDNDFSVQTGEQKSRGVELDVAGQVLPGWNIIVTYAYTDAFVSKDNVIPIGNQLVGVPYNSASLWTTYQLQSGNLKGLGFGLGLVYAGDVQVALPNTFRAPSYVRTDVALFYRRNNFRIGLNVKNLFSVKYFYTDGGFNLFPAPPLTVLGTVSLQF